MLLAQAAGLGILAFGVYWLLALDVFYKADGQQLVLRLVRRDPHYPYHRLYMPLLLRLHEVTELYGATPYETALLFSRLGVAVGVAASRIGFWAIGLPNGRAALATLAVAFNPATMLFGSVVELHGPYFGFAGLSFALSAVALRRVSSGSSQLADESDAQTRWADAPVLALVLVLLAGAVSAVGAGVHGSGLVLPALWLPWLCVVQGVWPRDAASRRRFVPDRRLVLAGLIAASHIGLALLVARPDEAQGFLETGFGRPRGIAYLGGVILDEVVLGLLPWSLLGIATLFRCGHRLASACVVVALTPYLYGALQLLVSEREFGAYFLPFSIAFAALVFAAWPLWVGTGAIVIGAIFGIVQLRGIPEYTTRDAETKAIVQRDRREEYRAYAKGLRASLGTQSALLLIGDPAELGPLLIHAHEQELYLLKDAAKLAPTDLQQLLPVFDKIVADKQKEGHAVLLTAGGRRFLQVALPGLTPGGPTLLGHIETRYGLIERKADGFHAWELVHK